MNTKRSCRDTSARASAEGMYLPGGAERENYRVCRVGKQLVRVWGSQGGRGLPSRVISSLRPSANLLCSDLPFALMADFHPCVGGVIGSVIPSRASIYPALIGADAGCGVAAVRLKEFEVPRREQLEELFRAIRRAIPTGSAEYPKLAGNDAECGVWDGLAKLPIVTRFTREKLERQFATLGGGNHFIELGLDNDRGVWIVVHTGSRYFGGLLASRYEGRIIAVESEEALEFLRYHDTVLEYARESRAAIVRKVLACLPQPLGQIGRVDLSIDTVHNFAAIEEHAGAKLVVHRKGACRAAEGDLGVIPGSMGTSSFVVEGTGKAESYASSSHGAGRVLARGEAFRELRPKDLHREMKHVVWAKSERLLDEAPQAYKDIDGVMRAQADLVTQRHRLMPILSVKGE
ncbi:MAG: RtcB family protein [Bdellovibrionota bacterium]